MTSAATEWIVEPQRGETNKDAQVTMKWMFFETVAWLGKVKTKWLLNPILEQAWI